MKVLVSESLPATSFRRRWLRRRLWIMRRRAFVLTYLPL